MLDQAQKHEYTPPRNNLSLAKKQPRGEPPGLSFLNPDAKTYMPPDAGDPLVKPKGTSAHHHGLIRPTFFFGFLDFLDFFKGWGPTPSAGGRLPPFSSDFTPTTAWNTIRCRPPSKLAKWGTRTPKNLKCYLSRTLLLVVLPSRTVSAYTHWQLLWYHTFNHACWRHAPSMTVGRVLQEDLGTMWLRQGVATEE